MMMLKCRITCQGFTPAIRMQAVRAAPQGPGPVLLPVLGARVGSVLSSGSRPLQRCSNRETLIFLSLLGPGLTAGLAGLARRPRWQPLGTPLLSVYSQFRLAPGLSLPRTPAPLCSLVAERLVS